MNYKLNAIALAILLGLTGGCGQNGPESGTGGETKGRLIGVTFQTMNNPFFVDLNDGIKALADKNGDRLVTLDAQWNSLKQKNDISDLILQGAAVIFINPVNWEGIKGSLIEAKKKGVPCIIVDAPVKDADLALCTVASDNVEAGRLAAQALVKTSRPARIGILAQSLNKACIDRVAGFKEIIAQYDDMEIVAEQEVKGNTESARPVMRDMIGRHPNLNAVFAINDPSALGAISALNSVDKLEGIKLVSVDGAPEALKAIENGKLLSTSAQFPREIGEMAAKAAYDHLAGKPVEPNIKIRVELITTDNVASFIKP